MKEVKKMYKLDYQEFIYKNFNKILSRAILGFNQDIDKKLKSVINKEQLREMIEELEFVDVLNIVYKELEINSIYFDWIKQSEEE